MLPRYIFSPWSRRAVHHHSRRAFSAATSSYDWGGLPHRVRDDAASGRLAGAIGALLERRYPSKAATTDMCAAYATLGPDDRGVFLRALASAPLGTPTVRGEVEAGATALRDKSWAASAGRALEDAGLDEEHHCLAVEARVRQSLAPAYDKLWPQILSLFDDAGAQAAQASSTWGDSGGRLPPASASNPNGLRMLLQMRADLLRTIRGKPPASASTSTSTSAEAEGPAGLARLKALDSSLQHCLGLWFNLGMLHLQRITWQGSPGAMLEKVAAYEKVHPTKRFSELRSRLGPGRRCFALTHPCLPDEPLVMVHIALVPAMAPSLRYIHSHIDAFNDGLPSPPRDDGGAIGTERGAEDHKWAIFWTISATQPGLAGIDMGHYLIKRAVEQLNIEAAAAAGAHRAAESTSTAAVPPSPISFATLSPIPGFVPWLRTKVAALEAHEHAERQHKSTGTETTTESSRRASFLRSISQGLFDLSARVATTTPQEPLQLSGLQQALLPGHSPGEASAGEIGRALLEAIDSMSLDDGSGGDDNDVVKATLLRLCARYLLHEKKRGHALCQVANFHLRNGAHVGRINWAGDVSVRGRAQSGGLMVNYVYNPADLERNQDLYSNERVVVAADEVEELAR